MDCHMNLMFRRLGVAIVAAIATFSAPAHAQEKSEITISRAYGLIYMATDVIEKRKLIEKHAAALGIPNLKINWITFSGGGAQTDSLLAGDVDIVNSGIGNLLLLWDRTKGNVKGIVGTSALPLALITNDPHIKSLSDIGPDDRIAVPTIKVSTHAVLLQIAAAKLYGPDQWSRLDVNTVQLGHPEAVAALANPKSEVKTHFSAPPYSYFELKNIPGTRAILQSEDIAGGPVASAQLFTTMKFANANPKIVQAVFEAVGEAVKYIHADPRGAIEIYHEIGKDKTSVEDLAAVLKQPGMMNYGQEPTGTMVIAQHLYRTGTLKTKPNAWTDYYLPIAHSLKGS
jgi:NitT/TauT family transport system substrate-binding protein